MPRHKKGRARDKVAQLTGKSRRTVDKIVAVAKAAEENPDLAPVAEEVDQTGNVDAAYKQVRAAKWSEKDRRRLALWKALEFLARIGDTYPDATALIDGFTSGELERLAESLDKRITYLQAVQKVVTKAPEPVKVLA